MAHICTNTPIRAQGFHPDWKTHIFNYGRAEVRSFLMSSAMFWLDKYHIDGLRVDAVASMLYLDYSRKARRMDSQQLWWHAKILKPSISSVAFNREVYKNYPDVQTYRRRIDCLGRVSRPTIAGGLGFGLKWDMGWMHDTLEYFQNEPIHRKYHQNDLTFRMLYAFPRTL